MITKNPDTQFLKTMKKRLKANSGYCPCAIEKTPDNKCKCKEFRDMIERKQEGWCGCGMYYAELEKGE